MPSPFPGMDPYLEGYLWPDLHHRLATEISRQLTPRLKPLYVARLEVYVVEDAVPEAEIGIMYPDVEIIAREKQGDEEPGSQIGEAVAEYEISSPVDIPPAPLIIPNLGPVEVRLASVEIRDVARKELITAIEILSPVNKREPGLAHYYKKRQRLRQAGVHLIEIDFIRRGGRLVKHPQLPNVPYLVALTRSNADRVELWPIKLQDTLPVVPVPLRSPDPDVPLELSLALTTVYDEAAYELSVDYSQTPPPPSLSPEDMIWLKSLPGIER
jgi:hypothetical protein